MTEAAKSRLGRPPRQREVALVVASAGTLFWLYTFYGIAQVPSASRQTPAITATLQSAPAKRQ